MNRLKTLGIVLRRTNYQEVDKIVSILTKDFGRISVLAKGVKKQKSRMAGGIEPFSVSKIDFLDGRGGVKTLLSARIEEHFENITKEYDRVELGGQMLRELNKSIEDDVEGNYFELARELLLCLNDRGMSLDVIEVWFRLQLLGLQGRQPELRFDADGNRLEEGRKYHFDPQDGSFRQSDLGMFNTDAIRGWRVLMLKTPRQARRVQGLDEAVKQTLQPLKYFMSDNSF